MSTLDSVDDIDDESVYLLDVPGSGTVLVSSADTRVYGDRASENGAGFSSFIDGRHDYDGDGWPDLVVGDYFWDGVPDVDSSPQGRFYIYRGESGPPSGP